MADPNHTSGDVLSSRWRIDAVLGYGAMGEVYRGQDLVLQRPVAIKTLAADLLDDEVMLARFRREAMSSSRLVHPNIVTTLDFGVDGTSPYIVMELVEGAPLDQIIAKQHRLHPMRVARLARGIALGLDAAHRHGIIHRDIKPGNVMVTDPNGGETARIMDFGIAHSHRGGPRLTQVGFAVGTPGFIAPEQLAAQQVGPPADLFALGVSMFEMLTGELPWNTNDPVDYIGAMLRDPPRPLEQLRPDAPPALCDLIMSMIRRKQDERPASAAVVAAKLLSIIEAMRHPGVEGGPAAVSSGAEIFALASASLAPERHVATQQLAWFQRVVEDEGGSLAQSIGREVLARLPSAEACLRLTRTHPPADVPRPSLGLHQGEVIVEDGGMLLGSGARAALRLVRLAGAEEVLLTQELHDAVGMGWRSRLEPRGRFMLDRHTQHEVFVLRGTPAEVSEPATVESHADGLHWRCPCGAHGRVPEASEPQMRVRCSMCSRLIEFDAGQLAPAPSPSSASVAPPAPGDDHPLTSIVLTAVESSQSPDEQLDNDLISALSGFDE
ncbi:MAG: protein kinase [Myxococcota bacterium]